MLDPRKLEQESFGAVLRQMPSGVVIAEAPSGEILLSNERAEQIRRYPLPPGVWLEKYKEQDDKFRGFHPDGRPYEPDEWPLARSIKTGEEVVNEEVAIVRGDDSRGTIYVSSSPIRDRDGSIVAGVAIFYDVTERKRAEEEVRRSEECFRLLVRNSSDIITILRPDGTVLYQSPSIERILGHKPEDRIGKNVFGSPLVHPDDLDRKRDFLAKVADVGPGADIKGEFRMRHADGSWRSIEAIGTNLLHDPRISGILANYRDITDRKRAEEEVRRLNEGLEERVRERTSQLEEERTSLDTILNDLAEGVLAVDLWGQVVFANPSARAILDLGGRAALPRELPDPWSEFSFRRRWPAASNVERAGRRW